MIPTFSLCNGRGVSSSSLVSCNGVPRAYTRGTTFVLEEPGRKWYYLKDQRVDEVAIFKNFDSISDVTRCMQKTPSRIYGISY